MSDLTGELLTLLTVADDDKKREALRVLRGGGKDETANPEAEPFLTLREISRRLGVSVTSLWRWGIPGHDLGGRRRFRLSEIEAYLQSDAFKARAEELKQGRKESQEA